MAWPSARAKNATNGGSFTPTDVNAIQDQYVRPGGGILQDDLDAATVAALLGLNQTASAAVGAARVRRGVVPIATEQTTASAAYTKLTTPDELLNVVLPTDGLIAVYYRALMKVSAASTVNVCAHLDGVPVKRAQADSAPINHELSQNVGAGTFDNYGILNLTASGWGWNNSNTSDSSFVTTGMANGTFGTTGWCLIEAAPDTYDVDIRFKTTAGTLSVKDRKLWVCTIGF